MVAMYSNMNASTKYQARCRGVVTVSTQTGLTVLPGWNTFRPQNFRLESGLENVDQGVSGKWVKISIYLVKVEAEIWEFGQNEVVFLFK